MTTPLIAAACLACRLDAGDPRTLSGRKHVAQGGQIREDTTKLLQQIT